MSTFMTCPCNFSCNHCITQESQDRIVLFKGDDSNFTGNQNLEIQLDTDIEDLTGYKAYFSYLGYTQEFETIPADRKLQLLFPRQVTSTLPLGSFNATLWIEDTEGRKRTASNRINIEVTNSVNCAYNNQNSQTITVLINGSQQQSDWNETDSTKPSYIKNKPTLSGTYELKSIDDLYSALTAVIQALGGTINE